MYDNIGKLLFNNVQLYTSLYNSQPSLVKRVT